MLEKLRDIIFRGRNPRVVGEQAGTAPGKGAENHVLLSRRLRDPVEDVPGFREVYYCTKCRDYFVLAWYSKSSSLVKQCDVIQDVPDGKGLAHTGVFCPKCQSDYAMYGPIQKEGTPIEA
jgi:hypothetical protein